jgi:hypothetical protein
MSQLTDDNFLVDPLEELAFQDEEHSLQYPDSAHSSNSNGSFREASKEYFLRRPQLPLSDIKIVKTKKKLLKEIKPSMSITPQHINPSLSISKGSRSDDNIIKQFRQGWSLSKVYLLCISCDLCYTSITSELSII